MEKTIQTGIIGFGLSGKEELKVKPEEAKLVIEIIEAAFQSNALKKTIEL